MDLPIWRMLARSRRVHLLLKSTGQAGHVGKELGIPAERLHVTPPPEQAAGFLMSLYQRLMENSCAIQRAA